MHDKIKDFLIHLLTERFPCVEIGLEIVESAGMVNEIETACPFSFTVEEKVRLFLRCAFKAVLRLVILAVLGRFLYPVSLELINDLKIPIFVQPTCHFISESVLANLLWNYI